MQLTHIFHTGRDEFMLRSAKSQASETTLCGFVLLGNLCQQPCNLTTLFMSAKHGSSLLLAVESQSSVLSSFVYTMQQTNTRCYNNVCLLLLTSEQIHIHSMHENISTCPVFFCLFFILHLFSHNFNIKHARTGARKDVNPHSHPRPLIFSQYICYSSNQRPFVACSTTGREEAPLTPNCSQLQRWHKAKLNNYCNVTAA